MGEFQITVIIACETPEDGLETTLNSLRKQRKSFRRSIQVITAIPEGLDAKTEEETARRQTSPVALGLDDCPVVCVEYAGTIWDGWRIALERVEAPYVALIRAGDWYFPDALERLTAFFRRAGDVIDAVAARCMYAGKGIPRRTWVMTPKDAGVVYDLEQRTALLASPSFYHGMLFRVDCLREAAFDKRDGSETWELFASRILDRKKKVGYVRQAVFCAAFPAKNDAERNKDNLQKGWYLDSARNLLRVLEEREREGTLSLFFQYRILWEIKTRFEANKDQEEKYALDQGELDRFLELCRKILEKTDASLLLSDGKLTRGAGIPESLQELFLELKYGGRPARSYTLEAAFPCIRVTIGGDRLPNAVCPEVCLDVLNYRKGALELTLSAPAFLADGEVRLAALLDGRELEYQVTERYAQTGYFHLPPHRLFTLEVSIPDAELEGKHELSFAAVQGEQRLELPIVTQRYTSRISGKVDCSYWCFGPYMVCFGKGAVRKKLDIARTGAPGRVRQELKMLAGMARGSARAKAAVLERLLYWLAWPVYHRKNIWLIYDKIYKGGDNGEYFYKYVKKRREPGIVPAYLLNADAPDMERLKKEGYQPLVYGSRKHRRMFLYAKMIFATHAGVYNFNAISEMELPYLQNLFNAEVVCIQHGLTVQNLAFNANQAFNNTKRYYCASWFEVENLRQPVYGYRDPEAIRLTGVPRYDGLTGEAGRQILITPTWRNYISLPAKGKNNARPYYEGFRHTAYFQIYNRLLSDEKLAGTARRTGYRLIFLVHPNISAQAGDFTPREGTEVLSATDVNYEEILTRSSLMVTDYSGVQFDFAYMRRPVVYYHPPELPPHYAGSAFSYEELGFGEICTAHEELVSLLCGYMEQGCRLKPRYRQREDAFFAYSDHENCRRIFEDALAYQRSNSTCQSFWRHHE